MQSANYVPGVSGWKLNKDTNELEVNYPSSSMGRQPDPCPITITAGEWPDSELPANAIERYAFIGAELANIPEEFRDRAEFKTEDFSFDRDGSDYRTTLTYVRPETQEEADARIQKSKVAGTRIGIVGGEISIFHDGVLRVRVGDLDVDERSQPFVVVDGAVYVKEALIKEASINNKIATNWSLKMELRNGKYVAAGMGLGIASQFLVSADQFRINCMCCGGPVGFDQK